MCAVFTGSQINQSMWDPSLKLCFVALYVLVIKLLQHLGVTKYVLLVFDTIPVLALTVLFIVKSLFNLYLAINRFLSEYLSVFNQVAIRPRSILELWWLERNEIILDVEALLFKSCSIDMANLYNIRVWLYFRW